MSAFAVGLIAGLPLAVVFLLYVVVRSDSFLNMLQSASNKGLSMSFSSPRLLIAAGFVLASLFFGVLASLVYRWIGAPLPFLALALGLAVLLSVLALSSRTPLPGDKVFMNLVVALILGVGVPYLTTALA